METRVHFRALNSSMYERRGYTSVPRDTPFFLQHGTSSERVHFGALYPPFFFLWNRFTSVPFLFFSVGSLLCRLSYQELVHFRAVPMFFLTCFTGSSVVKLKSSPNWSPRSAGPSVFC